MSQLTVAGLTIEVTRKRIKNIHLRVYPPDGRICLSAPLKTDDKYLRQFVTSKLNWLREKRAEMAARKPAPAHQFVSGEWHYFQGRPYNLKAIEGAKKPKVKLSANVILELHVPSGSDAAKRESILSHWYRRHLQATVPGLIQKWEKPMGVSVEEWRIRRMKTKWGTCNIDKRRIWLNLELAKVSPACLEYVVVHEMTHLLERNHTDRFRSLLDGFLPEWRRLEAALDGLSID